MCEREGPGGASDPCVPPRKFLSDKASTQREYRKGIEIAKGPPLRMWERCFQREWPGWGVSEWWGRVSEKKTKCLYWRNFTKNKNTAHPQREKSSCEAMEMMCAPCVWPWGAVTCRWVEILLRVSWERDGDCLLQSFHSTAVEVGETSCSWRGLCGSRVEIEKDRWRILDVLKDFVAILRM